MYEYFLNKVNQLLLIEVKYSYTNYNYNVPWGNSLQLTHGKNKANEYTQSSDTQSAECCK
jgi:hypothetical protein